jgi:hypothetical protein
MNIFYFCAEIEAGSIVLIVVDISRNCFKAVFCCFNHAMSLSELQPHFFDARSSQRISHLQAIRLFLKTSSKRKIACAQMLNVVFSPLPVQPVLIHDWID